MVLLPRLNLLPATLTEADAIPAETVNVALPSEVLPIAKLTVPVGKVDPAAGFTMAVTWVVAFCAKVGGLAATTVVVRAGAAATVTITEPADTANLLSPL
jgi:hypothetical protein